jgi:hypothetical protein
LREGSTLKVFENRVLRRIFGAMRDEVTEEWRKFHDEERNDLHSSLNIARVIKSRGMKLVGNIARMVRLKVYTEFWWRNLRERNHKKSQA